MTLFTDTLNLGLYQCLSFNRIVLIHSLSPFVNGKISIVKSERDYLNVITWANCCCQANHGQLFSY
jgi:hypothetical protein